jgi:hypothetical protein
MVERRYRIRVVAKSNIMFVDVDGIPSVVYFNFNFEMKRTQEHTLCID